jgi:hypothetical protein
MPIISNPGSSAASGGSSQLDYVENTTTAFAVTATSEGTAQSYLDGNAVPYNGSTSVLIDVNLPYVFFSAAGTLVPVLLDGATVLGWITEAGPTAIFNGLPVRTGRVLTPSAGLHTYHVALWKTTAATVTVHAGLGGSGADMPAWMRISR